MCNLAVLLLFASGMACAQEAKPGTRDTLYIQEAMTEALSKNPELQAFRDAHQASLSRVGQAGVLDDPMFSVMIEEAPSSDLFNSSQWKYVRYQLSQTIPFPGKLSRREQISEIEAEHALHDYQEKRLELITAVSAVFLDLFKLHRAIEINEENTRLMEQFVEIARTRYAVGVVSSQDLLKANVELARLANELQTVKLQEQTAAAMLNVLLGRDPGMHVGIPVLPEEPKELPSLEEMQALALRLRPMIIHDSLDIVQAEAQLSLARKSYLPDFTLGLQHVRSPLDGFRGWTAMVGISLPFAPWTIGRASGEVDEARAEINMRKATYRNTTNMVLFAVKEAYTNVETAERFVNLYKDSVLPQAEQSLNAAVAAYKTQQADFLSLLDSYRTLRVFQLEYYEALANYHRNLAALDRAVGHHAKDDRDTVDHDKN